MSYTPVELRHVRAQRGLLGYKRSAVDEILEDVADSFEQVWRERAELADKVEELEKSLAELRSREQLLATTLVSAEKAAAEAKDLAKREAEVIVSEAHIEARAITRAALNERERLHAETRRVEALLRSALGMLEETDAAKPEGNPRPETWPAREDTREWGRPSLVGPTEPAAESTSEPAAEPAALPTKPEANAG